MDITDTSVLQLMKDHFHPEDFPLQTRMVEEMCQDAGIALSFHLKSTTDYSIKLSPGAMVVQCNPFDELVSKSNGEGNSRTVKLRDAWFRFLDVNKF